ncbi:DNA polymerase domain-containing protein [Halegenticoccus tardaugens]|uniref:DNA polymerase domain-containing protein n=1 Tax=Halegenticoccus tardaugens TaxID=2071624 RepID=UPI00100B8B24|nr:DNA polymerase domain-containing protein [Halegenticoccus tardaugens]
MKQSGFDDFAVGGGDADRPTEEAAAVAGNGGGATAEVIDASELRFPEADGTVDVAVAQVDYTIEGQGSDEYPVIHVFGRTSDNEPVHVRVLGFRPYFYAPTDGLTDEALDRDSITGTEDGYRSIRGESLTKIYGRTPRDVGRMRDDFDHYEADILFPNRFLIDKDIGGGVRVPDRRLDDGTIQVPHTEVESVEADADLRVNTFDIEVDDRSGFPEDGEEPIVCLTSHDSYRDEYVAWLYEAPDGTGEIPDALDGYDPYRDGTDVDVRSFETEDAMLDAFIAYIEKTDPDVLTGWNFEDFDAPYFLDRLEVLNPRSEHDLSAGRLSRVNEVWRSGWGGPDIKGRVVFDLLYAYRRTQFSELESYRLDAVGELELDVGKERYSGDIGDLWEENPTRLLEYNVRDVELCVEIDRKQEVIPFWDEVRTFVGCLLEDAPTPGDAVDIYVLHKVHGNYALPSKGQADAEEYEGGAVFDPITGVKENVTVLDLKSLYPMCMVTINASPETKVGPDYDGETYLAPNGTEFRKEPDGIIRAMVDELLTERENKKNRRDEHAPDADAYKIYDRQQAAVKVIMNSLYGVLGWDRFRLYDKEMGAAVTATGREVIAFTQTAANEIDYEVAYGDSVTGDRPVVVRDPTGRVRLLPIEELFEQGRPEATSEVLITADGGPVAATTLGKERRAVDGWEALSVNENGESEWQPIKQAIRHETDKPIVTLQHMFGESTTTRDHSYVVDVDGELTEASPDDVDEPRRVDGLPDVDAVETIDVYEILSGYEREYEDGRSVGSAHSRTKVKRVRADDEYVWFGHEHHRDQPKTVRVQRYIDVDSEDGYALVRLLAAYVAEGSSSTAETTESRYGASIAESRREWLEQLRRDYYRLFDNTTASIVESDVRDERRLPSEPGSDGTVLRYDDRTLKLQMMNELAAVFFREFAGQTCRGKRVPSFVFHLPDELQTLFIRTAVEGDGSRTFPRYSDAYAERNFDFETVSRELAAGLSMLLTQRGQKHSLKYRASKGSYTIRTCDYYREGRDPALTEVEYDGYVYDLSVEKNENFVDGVGGIVLHNTDSVMLELGPDVTKEDAIEQSFEIESHINASYDEFAREELGAAEHRFEIEFEKLYRRFFQAGRKKRYAGHIVWKEGQDVDDIDITGFEYKRSDIAPITKRVQKRVIEMIVTGEDLEEVKRYVHEVITDFQAGNVDFDDVGIPGGIGKRLDGYDTDTAQVRGAKYANLLLGTNFQRGSKPKRLYLKKVHPSFFRRMEDERGFDPQRDPLYAEFKRDPDVICFEYADQVPDEFEVDWEKMLDKTLKGPIARVIEALDISWDEVKSGQQQTGLGSFL